MKRIILFIAVILVPVMTAACGNDAQNKIICSDCQKEISALAAFCEHCGFAVNSVSGEAAEETSADAKEEITSEASTASVTDQAQSTTNVIPEAPSENQQTLRMLCLQADCGNAVADSYSYCTEHRCKESGCYINPKHPSSDYCTDHKCGSADCMDCRVDGGQFCQMHMCGIADCHGKAEAMHGYCTEHKCADADCSNGRADGNIYCGDHSCNKNEHGSEHSGSHR